MISWDDFKEQKKMLNCEETNIACPKCGAAIWKSLGIIISYPPKHNLHKMHGTMDRRKTVKCMAERC